MSFDSFGITKPTMILTIRLQQVEYDSAIVYTTIFDRSIPISDVEGGVRSLTAIRQAFLDTKDAIGSEKDNYVEFGKCIDSIVEDIDIQLRDYREVPTQLIDFAYNLLRLEQFDSMRKTFDGKRPPTFLLDVCPCLTFKV